MNKKSGFGFVFFLTLFLLQIQICASEAYEINWISIQHRVYESQAPINRLMFDIKDDSGNFVSNGSVVTSVTLKYPDGSPVQLSAVKFSPLYEWIPVRFYPDSTQWKYDTREQLSDFYANIEEPLITGAYTLEVLMANGENLTATINFDFLLDLPIISSRTFQIHTDPSGNVHWTWKIPKGLLSLAKTYNIQFRAGVMAYNSGNLVALYWPNLPVEVGYSIVPGSIYQELVSQADEIVFSFQVRTSNSNARAYSREIIEASPSSSVSIIPKKSVVIVPLN